MLAYKIIRAFISVLMMCSLALAQASDSAPAADKKASLRSGDLIFTIASGSDMSQAIANATAHDDSLKFSHVGIVTLNADGAVSIIEASEKYGVTISPLDSFLYKTADGAIVKRLDFDFPVDSAIENARSFVGRNYDWWYLPDNDEIYCSELVEKSYRNFDGSPIFSTIPMTFRDKNGEIPQFWTDLFSRLGMEIPEGTPGTNPTQISKNPHLVPILRFDTGNRHSQQNTRKK